MAATYNLGLTTDVDQVRMRLGDVNVPDRALFQDEEIAAALALAGGSYDNAVATLQRWGVNRLASMVDFHIGDAGFQMSQRQKMTQDALAASANERGGSVPVAPFVGGISWADLRDAALDVDAVPQPFGLTTGDDPQAGLEANVGSVGAFRAGDV
jgi:hypothetical protein